MTKLEQLIEELSPNGVEYRKLSEVTTIERGKRVVKEQLSHDSGYPVFQNSLTPMGFHTDSNYPAETSYVIGAGAAGEIGHITVNYDEEDSCNCGKRGCLEQFASATGIVKEAKRLLLVSDKPSRLRDLQYLSAKAIFDAAKDGDELANDLVDQLTQYLGIAASHIAAVVDPEVFVIGGGVSKAGDILTTRIKQNYEKNVMFALQNKEFKLAELGNDAGIFGCAKMVLE